MENLNRCRGIYHEVCVCDFFFIATLFTTTSTNTVIKEYGGQRKLTGPQLVPHFSRESSRNNELELA